jgi:hypothetical protein
MTLPTGSTQMSQNGYTKTSQATPGQQKATPVIFYPCRTAHATLCLTCHVTGLNYIDTMVALYFHELF